MTTFDDIVKIGKAKADLRLLQMIPDAELWRLRQGLHLGVSQQSFEFFNRYLRAREFLEVIGELPKESPDA